MTNVPEEATAEVSPEPEKRKNIKSKKKKIKKKNQKKKMISMRLQLLKTSTLQIKPATRLMKMIHLKMKKALMMSLGLISPVKSVA